MPICGYCLAYVDYEDDVCPECGERLDVQTE